jgi:hypothetical protein
MSDPGQDSVDAGQPVAPPGGVGFILAVMGMIAGGAVATVAFAQAIIDHLETASFRPAVATLRRVEPGSTNVSRPTPTGLGPSYLISERRSALIAEYEYRVNTVVHDVRYAYTLGLSVPDHVTVFFDPADPSRVVKRRGPNWFIVIELSAVCAFAAAVLILGLGLACFIVYDAVRTRRSSPL